MEPNKIRIEKLRAKAKQLEGKSITFQNCMDDLNKGHGEALRKIEEKEEFCESAVRFFYLQKKREEDRYIKKRDEIHAAWETVLAKQGQAISEIAKIGDEGLPPKHSALGLPEVQRLLAEGAKIEVAETERDAADVAVNTVHISALPESARKTKTYVDSVAATTAYMYKKMGTSTLALHTRTFDKPNPIEESHFSQNAYRILKREATSPTLHLAKHKQTSAVAPKPKNTKSATKITKLSRAADPVDADDIITIPTWLGCVVKGAYGAYIEIHCPVCQANSTRADDGLRKFRYFYGVFGLMRHMCRSHPRTMDSAPEVAGDREVWLLDLFFKRVIAADELEDIINQGMDFNAIPHVLGTKAPKKTSTTNYLEAYTGLTAEDADIDVDGVDEKADDAATTKRPATPSRQHGSRDPKRRRRSEA
ncbi:hypothetical protein BU16DRAFT_332438 [Lophium mytilinum]|uniref:Uncharacterized protein n=1 Tax=Lophium mytilinum TaxID=390894 RepID=A0A6A6R1C1_9PEZI|nr:hypothetical protein BU16DRAFT_332438 [Lophium mytilinum]